MVVRVDPLGQAEIGDLGHAIRGEQDVARLEVAVDDAGLVGQLDGSGERRQQLGREPAGLRGTGQAVVQAAAFEQLQGHVRQAVDFADVVNLKDVGVAEPGDRLGLYRETA